MFQYRQAPPRMTHDGQVMPSRALYSGHADGLNNPNMEAVKMMGPIPRGRWRIVQWDDHHGSLGPIVAILEPVGHDALGRSEFRIHGDNPLDNFTGSDGCIVADHNLRVAMRASGDMDLEVL